ncbi:DMT family transporter [Oricola indica]|uniref:DMT family transporter n=1 Tax=Oricola indica TaxID=2872591 RepID=UPI001CBBD34E|nr:DMT family transporter [Oricola indica]
MSSSSSSSPMTAAMWMGGAILSFASMAISGREIQAELDTFELMAYRSVIGFVLICVVISFSKRGFSQVKTQKAGLHILRNVFHFTGQNLWFYGVAVIPLAQLVALEFTNPIWVALLAPLLLGERMTRARAVGALLGFIGVLIVARPGVAPLEAGHFAGLGAAVGFALNTLFTKKLMRTDTTLCVIFWMTASQTVMGFALAAPGGMTMFSAALVPWIVVVGVAGLTAHYCLTSALSHAPASVVAPMEFLRLPFIAVLGMLIYGEPLELTVFLGGAVILAGNLLNINAERRAARAAATSV